MVIHILFCFDLQKKIEYYNIINKMNIQEFRISACKKINSPVTTRSTLLSTYWRLLMMFDCTEGWLDVNPIMYVSLKWSCIGGDCPRNRYFATSLLKAFWFSLPNFKCPWCLVKIGSLPRSKGCFLIGF